MNITERMIFHCNTWNIMYSNCEKSKDIIGDDKPFDLIKQHGNVFASDLYSQELKSYEEQLLKKAIKRIGNFDKTIGAIQRFLTPVKIFHYEQSEKFKLWHGLVVKNNLMPVELTWITINNKLIDLSDSITQVKGIIPEGYLYAGIEIPRNIVKNIMINNFKIDIVEPNWSLEPNHTTIFIRAFNEIKKHYTQVVDNLNK